mmetsp:Transcript_35255/g.69170  ORF Transcript_35255/g.69170 Transcript_35255/m.69170 type:complete len:80 (+) Transcript_35255:146-385(+)
MLVDCNGIPSGQATLRLKQWDNLLLVLSRSLSELSRTYPKSNLVRRKLRALKSDPTVEAFEFLRKSFHQKVLSAEDTSN